MGGPIPWGFGAMMIGPPGIGKSSLAAQFAASAAGHGKKVCMYRFEESTTTFLGRCESLGLDLAKNIKKGLVELQHIDPSHTTPGQVIHNISTGIEQNHVGVMVIDSLNGYLQAMSGDRSFIVLPRVAGISECKRGDTAILVSTQHGFIMWINPALRLRTWPIWLSCCVISKRWEQFVRLYRLSRIEAMTMSGAFESLRSGKKGIRIGKPLTEFQEGVLTGNPQFVGKSGTLIRDQDESTEQSDGSRGPGSTVRAFRQRR